ncbi:MAG: three-Cys-motif partner protein TcmP [Cyclobacteriaceae bacterium]|nr:three-Cys-motif partner protein TcmP [Cyclobacteriaceae bacterium]
MALESPLSFASDGFAVTAAEPWLLDKTAVIGQYVEAFVNTQPANSNDLIFIDLFAGNGLYSLGAKHELFPTPCLSVLARQLPFTRYILCDANQEQLNILKIRTNKYFRGKNILLLNGRPAALADSLVHYIPPSQTRYKTHVLCLCDSFSLDLAFAAVQKLSELNISFLIPFCFALNDKLNYRFYTREARTKLDDYLTPPGAAQVQMASGNNRTFYKKLVGQFQNNMLALGYNISRSTHKADSGLMELPAYQIGFFSKTFSAHAVRQVVQATGHVQFELFQ